MFSKGIKIFYPMFHKSFLESFCQGCSDFATMVELVHNLFKQKEMQEENKKEETQENTNISVLEEEGNGNKEEGAFFSEEGNAKLKFVALFVVAVLVGVVIKTQAAKTVTMGFDDYKIKDLKTDFNLSKKEVSSEQESTDQEENGAGAEENEPVAPPAPSCGG